MVTPQKLLATILWFVLLATAGAVAYGADGEEAVGDRFPWQACDDPALWVRSPVWGPGNPRFSAEMGEKRQGSASVRVDYTLRAGEAAVGISPKLEGAVDLSEFGAFSLEVFNPEPRRKRIRTVLVGAGEERLRLRCEKPGRESGSHENWLDAGPAWTTLRFVFDPIPGGDGLGLFPEKDALRAIVGVAIVISGEPGSEESHEGYVLLDNLQLLKLPPGPGGPRYPLCFAREDERFAEGEKLLAAIRERFARGDAQGSLPDLWQLLDLSPNLDAAGLYLCDLYRNAAPTRRAEILRTLDTKRHESAQADPDKSEGYGHLRERVGRVRTDRKPLVVAESARGVPVLATVDVVVAGGSSAAVAAAEAAARAGSRVFLVAEQPYLGHDLAGTLRLWLEEGERPRPDLATRLFFDLVPPAGAPSPLASGEAPPVASGVGSPTYPLRVKQALDQALVDAGVEFLYGCYATELVVDRAGKAAGIVVANRSGRQAILARVVVDATDRALLARDAGAGFAPFRAGAHTLQWVTLNAVPPQGIASTAAPLPLASDLYDKHGRKKDEKRTAAWYRHTLQADLLDSTWPARARLEQAARDATYARGQLYASDTPLLASPFTVRGAESWAKPWAGVGALGTGVFRPKGVERLWVLSGCADLTPEALEQLLRPVAFCEAGAQVGREAAAEARQVAEPVPTGIAGRSTRATVPGEVKELLDGLRPVERRQAVPQAPRLLPVVEEYDVVVVGGGTSGAPAGIGAARQGAKTLVLEYLHGLGGVGTQGMIGAYWYGNRVGFTAGVPEGPTEVRMEWYRRELRRAGAEIWCGVIGCGVVMQGERVTGVVVATPQGRVVVLAKRVVDATGNAEIARVAGAPCLYVDEALALQASHFPPRKVGAWYINGDISAVDVADPIQAREVFLTRSKMGASFDSSQLIASRERQRVVGDFTLDWLDVISERTFPDSIVRAQSDYDSHGVQVHPFFALRTGRPPGAYSHQFYAYTPYRCLLPKGVEGMLVVGLGVSAHRDALPIIRMQPDLHNQGYAAGVAAAMSVADGVTPRRLDVKKLQRHLVEVGNLPESVLTDGDSFPLPIARVEEAVRAVTDGYTGLEVLMAQPEQSLPLLRRALETVSGEEALCYAHVLGVMGDASGVPALIAEAERRLQGRDLAPAEKGQPDAVARLIWAMGYTQDRRVVPALVSLAEALGPRDPGRFRALVISLGRLGDPAAAPVLAKMADFGTANPGRREMLAAVALYRCGDPTGTATALLKRAAQNTDATIARLATQELGR